VTTLVVLQPGYTQVDGEFAPYLSVLIGAGSHPERGSRSLSVLPGDSILAHGPAVHPRRAERVHDLAASWPMKLPIRPMLGPSLHGAYSLSHSSALPSCRGR
jgi:hypothetical protein